MEVEFADEDLARLECDPQFTAGFAPEIVRAYRKRMWFIRQAMDERDLYQAKGQRFEKLKGERSHQRSMRLNKQWRLILELADGNPEKTVRVVAIEDYH
jgi:proteic killer suppression protein